MNTNDEEIQEYRALRTVVGALIVALAIGVLGGLAAGKAIWKKPACEPEYILLEKTNGTFQVLTNLELVVSNTGSFTMTFPDFPRGSGKWGGKATNSP